MHTHNRSKLDLFQKKECRMLLYKGRDSHPSRVWTCVEVSDSLCVLQAQNNEAD